MAEFIKGDIVVIPFPFSDLSNSKKRPAMVLATLKGDDIILCQITGSRSDEYSIKFNNGDFEKGKLVHENNYIRPNRIFTADKSIILYKIGTLNNNKIDEAIKKLIEIINE
jgi:mRNA interferase MazF